MVHCSVRALSAGVSIFFIMLGVHGASAQVRSSDNYQIQSDSLNVGGGLSASENFSQESTVGEQATGNSDSETFNLYAGYQQMHEVYLSLSAAADVVLTPNIGGVTGGESNGSTSVVAISDGAAGYQLTLSASQSPAMQSFTDSIADYVPAGAIPDYVFTTDPTDAHFAFTPEGPDIARRYLDSTGACNEISGADTTNSCYDGLSTSPRTIAQSAGANHPDGATTTIYFKVGVGGSVNQPEGVYTATTTLTLLSL